MKKEYNCNNKLKINIFNNSANNIYNIMINLIRSKYYINYLELKLFIKRNNKI